MLTHWTYADFEPNEDLAQGDILEPTEELRSILREVHQHFLDPKYIAFCVLTQSCDLVRRANYRGQPINLCVVRELSAVADRLLELTCGSTLTRVFRNDAKLEGKKLLARIINQNEQGIGLFYLHPDADAGISTPSVAMLRISIALHARHYDALVAARRARLRGEFQAKLGWLIGNLYSRVGTADWADQEDGRKLQEKMINDVFKGLANVVWASEEAVRRAVTGGITTDDTPIDEVREAMRQLEPEPLDEQLLNEIARELAADDLGIPAEIQQRIVRRLRNGERMAAVFRAIKKK